MALSPDPPAPAGVALLGCPYDASSSFRRGAAAGPAAIREALFSDASNLWAETGVDLGARGALRDAGDLAPGDDPGSARAAIRAGVAALLETGARPLVLGGDHSITLPVLQALAEHHPRLHVLHLDAHPDLYDQLDGDRFSHACPFARALEQGLVQRLVQLGIRTLNGHQRAQAERFGVEVHEMRHWQGPPALEFDAPVYLSIDLDALDPAFAPGVAHREPGGLSVRELLGVVHRLRGTLVGADVVELNPVLDPSGVSAVAAAKIVKEVAGRLYAG